MSIGRLFAVAFIFVLTSVAWISLGGSVLARTRTLDNKLSKELADQWGPAVLTQVWPYWTQRGLEAKGASNGLPPAASDVKAEIIHDSRYKGLLWYSTYTVNFDGRYTIDPEQNPPRDAEACFVFPLPAGAARYNYLRVSVDGQPLSLPLQEMRNKLLVPLKGDRSHVVAIQYSTGGQDTWLYAPAEGGNAASSAVSQLNKFSLTVNTDFKEIDYPTGSVSPSHPARAQGSGMVARWEYDGAITRQGMGIEMPHRLNAGPIAARMSFFAPVSLLFFLTVLFAIVVLKRIALHPMHYLFVAAGFFAFNILLAYLADIINIHCAFWLAAMVSVALVVSYMRLVAGIRFAVFFVAIAQLVYLVGFSYAFFWEGRTGLAVTLGAVATLFVLMQATGRVNWHDVFSRTKQSPAIASPPPFHPMPDNPTSTSTMDEGKN